MARTDEEVIQVLRDIYADRFGGKEQQRFLISWGDLRAVYGFRRLWHSRFEQLAEAGFKKRLYLWDLGEGENGHLVAVIKSGTIDRWRRVPKKIIEGYKIPPDDDGDTGEEDSD